MPIPVDCPACDKQMSAPDRLRGKQARCSACGAPVEIPDGAQPAVDELLAAAPVPPVAGVPPDRIVAPASAADAASDSDRAATGIEDAPGPPPRARSRVWRRAVRYLIPLLALVPLVWPASESRRDVRRRIARTVDSHPLVIESRSRRRLAGPSAFAAARERPRLDVNKLLGDQIEGALLKRSSWTHWWLGLVSGGTVLLLIRFGVERGGARTRECLLIAGVQFVVGLVLVAALLGIARYAARLDVRQPSIHLPWMYLAKFIGFSQGAALESRYDFWTCLASYTLGAGLCQELVKVLPVLLRIRFGRGLSWQAAGLWGLAAGVGLGAAESIVLSGQIHNGIRAADVYRVQFISLVALQATWSATSALVAWHLRTRFARRQEWGDLVLAIAFVLALPIVLHGLFDTLLKRFMFHWAFLVGVASVVALAAIVEWTRRAEPAATEVPLAPCLATPA